MSVTDLLVVEGNIISALHTCHKQRLSVGGHLMWGHRVIELSLRTPNLRHEAMAMHIKTMSSISAFLWARKLSVWTRTPTLSGEKDPLVLPWTLRHSDRRWCWGSSPESAGWAKSGPRWASQYIRCSRSESSPPGCLSHSPPVQHTPHKREQLFTTICLVWIEAIKLFQ